MFIAKIDVQGPAGVVAVEALLDTGFEGGLWLPRPLAAQVGATFARPARQPKTIEGRAIRGSATLLTVRFSAAGVEAEALVFCPSADVREVLVGAHLLATVKTRVVIGNAEYLSAAMKPNRARRFDLGDWVLPTDRPVTPWW